MIIKSKSRPVVEGRFAESIEAANLAMISGRALSRTRLACVLRWLRPTHRVMLSVFGSYAVVSSSVAALAMGLSSTGLIAKGPALVWMMLAGYVIYFAAALWAFVETRPWRVWVVFILVISVSIAAVAMLGGDPTFGFRSGR